MFYVVSLEFALDEGRVLEPFQTAGRYVVAWCLSHRELAKDLADHRSQLEAMACMR